MEDAARILFPDQLYIEASEGQDYQAAHNEALYEPTGVALTVGVGWDLTPIKEVRVVNDRPREWYEEEHTDDVTITIPGGESGAGVLPYAISGLAALLLGGGGVALAKKKYGAE